MRRLTFIFIAILALVAGLAQSGLAITISDVYADLNFITSQTDVGNNTLYVFESYGETHLIPYPSHDGYAIVNASNQFFDKVVTPVSGSGNPLLHFVVPNAGPYTWSDYHFEIYDSTFTTRLAILGSATIDNPYFQNSAYTYTLIGTPPPYDGVNFWGPTDVNPGQTAGYFDLNFTSDASAFGIRQIATTEVPLPGAVWLLGSGLAGLLGFRGFRRRS